MADRPGWLRRSGLLLAALAGLSGAVSAAPPASAPPVTTETRAPRPAIWVVEDEDTKIYLFGTVHVFSAALNWRSAALNRVIAEADELVMETPEASFEEMADPERLLETMKLGKSVPILERVSPEARPHLRAAIEATGMPSEFFDEMTTWGVAFLLTGFQMTQSYGEEAGGAMSGAEEVLGRLFRKSKRPVSGVETIEDQIRIFSTMPVGAQRRFLESTVMVGDPTAPQEDLTDTSWISGDVEAIGREMREMPDELYEPLLTRRNRNWTAWLVRRMERPGTVLFAVGAGHLAGADSVQRMLAARGVTARRID